MTKAICLMMSLHRQRTSPSLLLEDERHRNPPVADLPTREVLAAVAAHLASHPTEEAEEAVSEEATAVVEAVEASVVAEAFLLIEAAVARLASHPTGVVEEEEEEEVSEEAAVEAVALGVVEAVAVVEDEDDFNKCLNF